MSFFLGERLYEAVFSCDIDHVSVSEEKLAGVDQALADLGKSDDEISEVRGRFASGDPLDLQAVDSELNALSEGASTEVAAVHTDAVQPQAAEVVNESWDDENTDIEIVDESDFVLLVDEDDLEELEKVGEDDACKTSPPALPQEGEEDAGFFKKLFGNRSSSNRP